MPRTTKTITISVPPEMLEVIQALMRLEGRTQSELIREAVRRYAHDREWSDLLRYGRRRAAEAGIRESEIEDIVDAGRG